MSELREVFLCEDCQARHDEPCGVLGCECWCREDESSFWAVTTMLTAGLMVADLIKHAPTTRSEPGVLP